MKRRLAGEAVWRDGIDGLWRCKGWETSGSQTPTKTGIVRLADGLTGLGRNGPLARTEVVRSRQRSCVRRQDARTARTPNAGDALREALTLCVAAPR